MNAIKISIITPAFNAKRFLGGLFETVKAQTYQNYEHIIVDDCSTDGSNEILKDYAKSDKRVKILRLKTNRGVVVARNIGLENSTGELVAFLDADDLWLPEKLSIQLEFMLRTGAVISFTDYRFINEKRNLIGRRLKGPSKVGWHIHHMTRYLGCLTVMIDRRSIPDFSFGEISPEYRAEDFLAWSKVIKRHKYALRCPYDLARYTTVKNSRSSNGLVAAKSVWSLYRQVECIPFLPSLIYFISYTIFSFIKRMYCAPKLSAARY